MMRRIRSFVSILLVIFLLPTQGIYAEEALTTNEVPSGWARWDVQMAYTYGLGNVDTYKKYTDEILGNQFLVVEASFESKFVVTDETKIEATSEVTRGDVIKELYDIIQLSLKTSELSATSEAALTYFVENGLIKGRANGDYALDQACTQEEMLVFAKRAYDYLIYALDLEAKGAFWKVSDEDNTVYLLGSIHLTDGSVYPMSKEILQAFDESDALVVEANILVPNPDDTTYIQQKMMIEGDGTIDQLISKETYDAYVAFVQPLGVAPEVYNKLKPWYGAMLVQSVQMSNASYNATMGIDLYFLSMAYQLKPIVELEGIKFQIDLFDSFTPELQESYLQGVLESEESTEEVMTALLSNWAEGDVKELEALIFPEEATTDIDKEFNSKLIDVRNENMLDQVEMMLTQDTEKDYFVVVGAGHMVNDNGLVQGLIDLGYTVEQVK